MIMSEDICFFEANSMQHAILLVKEKFGVDGVILSYEDIQDNKILICASKQINGMSSLQLKVFSKCIKKLIDYDFSEDFISKAYKLICENYQTLTIDVISYIEFIFSRLIKFSVEKNKTFVLTGAYGVGKTTIVTKLVKNCIESGITPEVYYCDRDNDIGIYSLVMYVQNFNVKPQKVNVDQIKFFDNYSVNIVDTQSVNCQNERDFKFLTHLFHTGAQIIYVIRSDIRISTLKRDVSLLKEIGIKNFIVNHSSGLDALCQTISVLVENDCEILTINKSKSLQEKFSFDPSEILMSIVNNEHDLSY